MIRITFETHSTSLDNEAGLAAGWHDSPHSDTGREQARALGARRPDLDVLFVSDLGRALETAAHAFEGRAVPRFTDWRLRECNYGALNGRSASEVHGARLAHVETPYPGGESYRDVVARVASFLRDIAARWDDARILVIGHSATRYALDHLLAGRALAEVVAAPGEWRPGWTYRLEPGPLESG